MKRQPKAPRSRNAKAQEIDSRLRSAGDYLGLMIQHESEASDSVTGHAQDLERHSEAHRKFARDYHAFLGAAAVAWNYMIQAADAAGTREWLDGRLASNLFEFHRALENQAKHDYEVVVGVNQKVRYEAAPGTPMIRSAVGVMPARATITGFEGMTFHHKPGNLEPDVAPLCESVLKKYPDETVVQLACRYLDGLRRAFNTGERAGKFGTEPSSSNGQVAATVLESRVDTDG